MFAMIPHRLLAKLGAGSAWRWCRRRVTKKLVRQVLTQLVCFSLVFGDFAFIIPNLAQAEGIVPDGQTATDVTYGPDAIDVTTSTIHGNSALNSFKLFDVYTGEIVNLHIPVGATNLLNLVHEKKSQIDGIVNAYKNGSIGGNVYFLNPYGMIVGEKGRLNVGQLTVITPPPTFMEQFFTDLDNSVNRVLSGDAEIDDAGEIRIEGEINATQGLTLLAGQVTNTGRLVVDVTQSPDFADLVNLDGLESGNEIRISNGNIEIVATGDVTNSGEILTTVKGNTDLDAGDITIDAGGRIVIEKAGVIDARGGMENSSGGDVRLSAEERVEHAGQIYTGSEQKDAQGPAADPSGTVSLLAPEIYISGLINAGTHEDGISSGDVYITARRDSGGTARIRLDGAEVFGRDIFIAAGSSLVDNEATGLVRPEVTASIEMYSKAHPDRFTLIQAGRDVGLLAEARVELEVGAAVESGDTYDAGYAAVDVDSTSRIQLLEMAGIIAGGDVEIEARNTVNISTTVNPAAQGAEGDYIGGSVAVNRVTTRTEALINSGMPLEVSSLSVKATSANTVTAVATAPASGAQEDPGQESRMARTLDEYREDAQTSEGAISVAAALAINDITSTTRAEIGGDAGVVAQGRVDVISNATYNSAVNADAASVVPGEGTLGAALGINKVNSQNYALLDTEVSAGEGISVAARMTDDELDKQAVARLSTIATSGGGAGGTSVSGALAVNVQRTDSGAFISRDIETIGGNIDVISVNLSENTAEAKPGQTGGRPGIGPSVAVNVAINSTRAGSPDDALLSRLVAPDSDGSGVKIRAVSEHDVSTTAEAGAGGDIGFAPAVALAWVENTTHAGLGAAAEELWSPILGVSGDIHIAADAKERVTTRAVGQNAEEGRAFGTAIALTVGESSTEAYTARGIDTDRKVIIEAKNSGTINTEAIAGIGGGQKADDETPENGVDQKIADQKALIQDKREAVTGEGKNKEAPAAETGEGQARVAGAIGVSLVTATTRARIADDTQMWAGAGLTLRSAANIDTAVVANGSTVSGGGSGAGVGAAVAINQAILTNEAYLGSGFHYAGNFTIEAITLETGSGEKTDKESSHSAEATSGAGSAEVGVAGSLAINLTESRTIARTGDQAHLSNGAVNISASEQAKNIARAVPAKSQVGGKEAEVGVGASVAVNVVLGETVAEIGDEAMIEANREGAGISVTANGDYSVTTEAHGGAAGDVAVTPAVAVTVAERVTLARLGVSGGNGAQPNIAVTDGDLTVRARSKENITTTAKGSSQGGSAAIGAAVAVALVDGTTEAVLAYQVESQGKVTVEAASAGVVESSATAGAKGEKEKDASTPEDGVDKKVKEQTTLAEKKRDEAKGGERGADQGQGDQGGGGASGEPTDPKPAPSAETGEGKVGVAGAIGVNVVTSTTRARTADDISVNATGNFTLLAAANNDTKVSADGSTVSGGGNGAGVGAAVAINQATLTNEAYLGSGSFHADSITIEAKTLETGSGDKADKENVHSAEATSGAGSAKISVAGSLAINLTESRTIARTGSGTLLSSGSIKISAAEQAKNIAKALPAKSQVGGKETEVGVGASVAVNVVLGETTAELGDEGAIDATREGAGVGVVATGDYTITTEAQGGATGDVAVTPAVAVTVAERATLAKLGFSGGSDGQPNYAIVDGDISVEAISKESITTTAKGSSQGETAAIGAAVAVALVDNTTEAILAYHVVSQGLVNIEAKSIGKVETGAVAGAKGEKEKDASTPEDGVDKKVKEQTTLAEKKRDEAKGGERGADQGQGDQDGGRASGEPTEPKPVPSAETGEGKVGVAGAIGVNVVTSNTRARTADGVNISAAGDLTLQAAANTDTKVAADGSTVGSGGSGAGVGAAVAINQATLTNEAYLGSGNYTAKSFTIEAKTLEIGSGDKADKENTHSAEATSGAGSAKIGVAGSLAINLTESRTIARTGAQAYLDDGSVNIAAAEQTKNIAKALPAKAQVGGQEAEVGIGASVAVNVVLGETTAELGNETTISATRENAGVSVTATGDYTITTEAQGGAAGDVAVTPAVALTVSERVTRAQLGASGENGAQPPGMVYTDGSLTVKAQSQENITTTAKGSSRGDTAAIGAAVAVALVDNTTEAAAAHVIESPGKAPMIIEATNTGKVETEAIAGAKGEKEKDTSTPEDGVDSKVREQTALAAKKREEAKAGAASGEPAGPIPVPSAETGEGKAAVAGAIGVNVVASTTRARTADNISISTSGQLTVSAAANTAAIVRADGSTVTGGSGGGSGSGSGSGSGGGSGSGSGSGGGTGVGVGAAVAINQATAVNEAYLGSGLYNVDELAITAKTLESKNDAGYGKENIFSAKAVSGAGADKVGVAGSLAINLSDSRTSALVGQGVVVESPAATMEVSAQQFSSYEAMALPTKEEVGGGTVGVGASVAVNVVLSETLAELTGDAEIETDTVNLTAIHQSNTNTVAQAGTIGGVAVTPAVAVTVSEQKSRAATNAQSIIITDQLILAAEQNNFAATLAKGHSEGADAAIGSALALAFVTNDASAVLAGIISSDENIQATARQESRSTVTAEAGAKGGQAEDENTPKDGVDQKLQQQKELAERKREEAGQAGGRIPAGELDSLPAAQADEGSVSVAGAIGVNVFTSAVRAYSAADTNLYTYGRLGLETYGRYATSVIADGSVVEGGATTVGVGAAVAINKTTAANEAYLDRGQYTARTIAVRAQMIPGIYNQSIAAAISGAGANKVGVAGSLALQLVDTATAAQIRDGAVVNADGGDLQLMAISRSGHGTVARPAEEGTSGTTVGIGASVAIFRHTDATVAEVEENGLPANLRFLSIGAEADHSSETEAIAGAKGGVAIDSVVAMAVINQRTYAGLGAGQPVQATRDINIKADDKAYHGVTAIGDVESSNVGAGSSVALLITDSDIGAVAMRDLLAGGSIYISAQAYRRYDASASAGAMGAADREIEEDEEPKNTSSKALKDNADSQRGTKEGGKVLVAAAVAMTILDDDVEATIDGSLTGKDDIILSAVSHANYSTRADGSTASWDNETGISNAVALNIIRNDTTASAAAGSEIVNADNVVINAVSTTNMDDSYVHKLAAEALSGAGATKVGVAGALAVTHSMAKTQAFIGNDAQLEQVGDVSVSADNTGRLSVKAWSGGAGGTGVGASVATIVSENQYRAYLGDNIQAQLGSLFVFSRNNKVDTPVPFEYRSFDDLELENLLGRSNYYTEALAGAAASKAAVSGSYAVNVLDDTLEASVGLGSVITSRGPVGVEAQYDATARAITGNVALGFKVGVGTAMTDIINTTSVRSTLADDVYILGATSINVTAAADTDISSFAASAAGTDLVGVAGVTSLIVSNNQVEALVGDNSILMTSTMVGEYYDNHFGDVYVRAINNYQSRNIAGDAAGGRNVGVGGSQAVNTIANETVAAIGKGAGIDANHGLDVAASSTQDLFTIAAGGAGGEKVGVAGSTTVNTINTVTHAYIGEGVIINPVRPLMPVALEQYISITATDTTDLTSVAGGAAFGGNAGVSMGLDVTVFNKNTQAYVASATADPTVINVRHLLKVAAQATQNFISVVGGAAGSINTGVAGNVSLYTVNNHTLAYIGKAAQVSSYGHVLISADDDNTMRLIGGHVALAGTASVGASGAVVIIDKTTKAFIDENAAVSAKGMTAAVMAHTGRYNISYEQLESGDGRIERPDYNLANLTGDTEAAGDDVFDNQSMTKQRKAALQTEERKGLAVTATTKDHIESIAAGGAVAGTAAVSVAATVSTVWNNTEAYIAKGARINMDNAGAAAEQAVFVGAGTDFYHLGIAGTIAASGSVGVGPGTDLSFIFNTTKAYIGEAAVVNAAGSIEIDAYAHEDILSITAAAAGGGIAGVAGGAAISNIENYTHAYAAADTELVSLGNIRISAADITEMDVITGSLGVGVSAGVGQALDVAVINKDTRAYVGDRAMVDARGHNGGYMNVYTGEVDAAGHRVAQSAKGLLIEAGSKEDIFNVVASGGAGIWAGVAGAVTVNKINATTLAYAGDEAVINPNRAAAHSEQGINIIAVNDVIAKSITGSVGGAFVGVSGAVDIGIIKNTTAAYTGRGASLYAAGDVGIITMSGKKLTNYALGHAGGAVGVTGGVSIWTIGADLDLSMQTPTGEGKTVGDALEFEDGGSVEGLIDRHLYDTGESTMRQAGAEAGTQAGAEAGYVGRASTSSGDDEDSSFGAMGFVNVVDFLLGGYISTTIETIESVRGIVNQVLFSLAVAGLVGDDANSAGNRSYMPQQSISGTYTASETAAGAATAGVLAQPFGGTRALLGEGTTLTGRHAAIVAREDVIYNQTVVGASTGAAAAGAAVGITTLRNHAEAQVGMDAALYLAGTLKVGSVLTQKQDIDTIAGTLGFFGSLGGTVAGVTDTGSSKATVDAGAVITGGGDILISADTVHQTDILAVNAGMAMGAVNGTVVWGDNSGQTQALIGRDATLTAGGTLAVGATSKNGVKAQAYAPSVGAFLGIGAVWASLFDDHATTAKILGRSEIAQAGAVQVQASHTPYLDVYAIGAGSGAAAVGAAVAAAHVQSILEAVIDSDVKIGQTAGLSVGSLTVSAVMNLKDGEQTTAKAQTDSAAASPALAGAGSDAVAHVTPVINAYIGARSLIKTLQDVQVLAISHAAAAAQSRGLSISGLGAGLAFADALLTPYIRSYVGESVQIRSGGNITVLARHNIDARGRLLDTLQAKAEAWSATGTLLAGATGADADADASATLEAYIAAGDNSMLLATGTLTVNALAGNLAAAIADGQAYSTGIGVGAVFADATIRGTTLAHLDTKTVDVRNLHIEATTREYADALTKSGAGAILAGSGSLATAIANSTTKAYTGYAVTITATETVQLSAGSLSQANAAAGGVNAGMAAVGVSLAEAQVAPIVQAYLGGAGRLTAADLTIKATARPLGLGDDYTAKAFASGSSGGLVGVNATGSEAVNTSQVSAWVGYNNELTITGTALISATADFRQEAKATAITGGVVAMGANDARATSATNISAYLSYGVQVRGGVLQVKASGTDDNYAEAIAGTGGVVAGTAASSATSTTGQTVAYVDAATSQRHIDVNSFLLEAGHTTTFNAVTDSTSAAVVGMSGASAINTVDRRVEAKLVDRAMIKARQITITAANTIIKNWLDQYQVRSGSGGLLDGAAASSITNIANEALINIGSQAHLEVYGNKQDPGHMQLTAVNTVQAYDRARLDAGAAIEIALVKSEIRNDTHRAAVHIGANANLLSVGDINISAKSDVDIQTRANARTYGGAGAAQGESLSSANIHNIIDIAGGASLLGLGQVYLRTGSDNAGINGQYNLLANTDLWNKTAVPIETDPEARAILFQTVTVNIQPGATVKSAGDAYLSTSKGLRNVVGYGVGTDHYREFLAEIGQLIEDTVGDGEDVSLKKEFHSSKQQATTTVQVDGLVHVGIENKRYLYIDADGNVDTGVQADGTATSEGISISLTVQDLRAEIEQRIRELENMEEALTGYDTALYNAEKNALLTERADKVSKISLLEVERANRHPVNDAEEIAAINNLIDILNARIQAIDYRLYELEILGGGSAQQLLNYYNAEIAALQFQLAQLGDRPQVTVINVNEPITARSGNIYVTADSLIGAGRLVAAGDTTIKIENRSPHFLRTNQMIIPDHAGGQLFFNKVAVTDNAQINARSFERGASFSEIQTTDNAQSLISVVNSYIPTGDSLGPDIFVDGDIRNLRGRVDITSLRGSIQVKDGVNLVADSLNISAGRNLSIGYSLGFKSIAGDIEAHWRQYTDWVEDQGWIAFDPGPQKKPGDLIDITWADEPSLLLANNIFIAAEYLNINGIIQSGIPRYELWIDESLESEIAAYKQQYDQAKAAGQPIDRIYTGLSINPTPDPDGRIDITKVIVKYDAEDDCLELEPIHIMGGYLELYGHIMNTSAGKLRVMDGYGTINIINDTSYTLRLDDINTGNNIEGTIKITDTAQKAANGQPLVTVIKRVGSYVETYTNAQTGVLNLDNPVSRREGRTGEYKPLANQYYSWTSIESTLVTETRNWYRDTYLYFFDSVSYHYDNPIRTPLLEPTKIEGAVVRQVPGKNSTYWYEGTHYYTTPTAWENMWDDWQLVKEEKILFGLITYHKVEKMLQERTSTITQIHNHNISASHPIAIEFIGNDFGELNIFSNNDIVINGAISNTRGTTSLTSSYGAIRQGQNERAHIAGEAISLWANKGIGETLQPLTFNQVGTFNEVSSNLGDVVLNVSQGDVLVRQMIAVTGDVNLVADGSIRAADRINSFIYGKKVELTSLHGGIGDNNMYVMVDTQPQEDGGLTATALGDIYLWEKNRNPLLSGDLYVNQVISRSGDVHLGTEDGDLIDNHHVQVKDTRAEQGLLSLLWDEMELLGERAENNAERTVRAYEQKIEREYFLYWQYRQRQVTGKGRLPLPADQYHPEALIALTNDEILYYKNELGWTDQQIAAYEAKMTGEFHELHKSYGHLGDEYNTKWTFEVERPKTDDGRTIYDPKVYDAGRYKEWDSLVNGHAWTPEQLTNVIGSIKEVTDTRIWIEEPNIIGHNVSLQVNGSIGHDDFFEVPVWWIIGKPPLWNWKDLTPDQQLLILAAEKDDIYFGSTKMTVNIRETVDIEATGKVTAEALDGFIYLASESDINLDHAFATEAIRIKTAGTIRNANPGVVNVQGANVVLEAAYGSIGNHQVPLLLDIGTSKLTARAAGNIYLQTENDLHVDTIYTPGHATLTAGGSIKAATATQGWFVRDDLNIRVKSLTLNAGMDIGGAEADSALQIGLDPSGTLSAVAGGRIAINSPRHDLLTSRIEAGGDIVLSSSGDIRILSGRSLGPDVTGAFGTSGIGGKYDGSFWWTPPELPPIDLPPLPEPEYRYIKSLSGKVTINAGGSILDGDENTASNISGRGITLTAGGAIGTADNALEIHLMGQTGNDLLNAHAQEGVYITAPEGVLQAGNVSSATADVHLTTLVGYLRAGSITADNGTVALHSAGDIFTDGTSASIIRGRHIELVSAGNIGNLVNLIMLAPGEPGYISLSASAGKSMYLQGLGGDLLVERLSAAAGDVFLASSGTIVGRNNTDEPHITLLGGDGILFIGAGGHIGTPHNPFTYSTKSKAGIMVMAENDIYLTQPDGDIVVNMVVSNTGNLVLRAPGGSIYAIDDGGMVGAYVTLSAQGDIGGDNPLMVAATEKLFAEAGGSAFIYSPDHALTLGDMHAGSNMTIGAKDLVLDGIITADGDLHLVAINSILGHSAQHGIIGKVIKLEAHNGSIGTSNQAVIVGKHIKLNAEAYADIFLEIRGKDLISDYIKSHIGKVEIYVPNGSAVIGKVGKDPFKPLKSLMEAAQGEELWGLQAVELVCLLPSEGSSLSIGQANISGSMQLNADLINVEGLYHTGAKPLQVVIGGGSRNMAEQLAFSGKSDAGFVFNGLAGQMVEIDVDTKMLQLQNTQIGSSASIKTDSVKVLIYNKDLGGGTSDVLLKAGSDPFDLTIGKNKDIWTNADVVGARSGFTVNGRSGDKQPVLRWQPLLGGVSAVLIRLRTDTALTFAGAGLVNMDIDMDHDTAEEGEEEAEEKEEDAAEKGEIGNGKAR